MTTADVRFDFLAASDLAAKCRAARSRVDELHGARVGWVFEASQDFSGYFSRLFADNSASEGVDATNLCACLEDVAAKVDRLVELARAENAARQRAREWQARRDQMWEIQRGWNDFWDIDQRPVGTNGQAPSLEVSAPAMLARQTPSSGTNSESGTSSARPENLRRLATNYGGADDELGSVIAGLRAAEAAFVAGCEWGSLSAGSVWTGFDSYIAANRADAQWANVIASAFEAAGGSGVVSTLSDATLMAALAAAGVSLSRLGVNMVPAQMQGVAPSSGFVDDPVNAATGNFIEPETDLELQGGGVGLAWRRMYNSMSTAIGAFGPGWCSVVDSRIEIEQAGETDAGGEVGEARWWMPDGRLVRFPREGQGWGRSLGDSFWISRTSPNAGDFVVCDAEGGRWTYDDSGRLRSLSRGPGTTVFCEWDGDVASSLVHERGRHLDITWDDEASRIVEVSGCGRRVVYSYDEGGRLVEVRGGDGGARRYDWDDAGSVIWRIVDADGVVEVENTYDEAGRVCTQRSPAGRLSRYTYIPGGVTEVSDSDGSRANTWINDDFGRLIGVVDADGGSQRLAYDRWGRRVMSQDRSGSVTVSEYDSRGRMVASLDPAGVRTTMSWDELDRLTEVVVSYPAPAGHEGVPAARPTSTARTRFSYEGECRDPSLIIDPVGGRTTMVWENGLLRSVTDPVGVSLTYEYNRFGDLIGIVNAQGGRASFDYDQAGRPVTFTTPGGSLTRYVYDEAGRVVSRVDPDGAVWAWEFSPAGRLTATIDPYGARSSVEYGPSGLEASSTDPLGRVISSTWDDLGNLAQVRLPDGRT
ncbi:RHS repeat protein [Schaalia sp. 19OD2882]|uniref:DUF6531 domain-containing protein n=1 Tax=Schaalia sp. 19OD2882 TaxID=2794089 RepID=UPI001C1EB200|nr:DUF6531 domain-containing protein [Schaalia sp. 19OD2882]QWW19446.1 RHS repeat protein [Schaalia sp. 19OD2882]